MDFVRLLCLAAVTSLLVSAAASSETKQTPTWKEHPYLFVERSEVPEILTKAQELDWAKATLEGVRKTADNWLEREIEYPPSTGRHSVTYVCPECREPLKTLSPTQHQCPKCEEIYSGLPYDAHLYGARHSAIIRGARDLGLASLFFDDPKYARKALDILLGYADRYADYPLIDNRGGQSGSAAKLMDQTLNDAILLIDVAWAYDLVLGADVGTPEERRKVEEEFLLPFIDLIRKAKRGVSNWQSWHNAGLMAAGLTLKDEELVDEVINCPQSGYLFQMKNSIESDGMWYEGSWSYHSYAVSALLKTAEAAWRSGINLYEPELKKALEAPLHVTMPNGRYPALNDGLEGSPATSHYEYAAARYGDSLFQNVIATRNRGGLDALLLGIPDPQEHPDALGSMILEGSGLVILRRGDQYVCMDFGPHGGGHGHLDKLALNFFTTGQVFAPDPGRGWPYNLPIHQEWYKRTLSHNTIVVDEKPQKECEGVLESYDFEGDYHTATATANDAYEGVKIRRTIAMSDTWLLDVVEVESEEDHIYDWVWHGRAEFETKLLNRPIEFEGSHASYNYLRNVRRGSGWRDWRAVYTMDGGQVHALFKGSPGRIAILCDVPDNPRTKTLNSVILRDRAKTARFAALFSREPMTWSDLPPELQTALDK